MALPILPFVAGAAVGSLAAWLSRDRDVQRAVRERFDHLVNGASAELGSLWPSGRGNGAAAEAATGTLTVEEAVAGLTAVKGVGESYAQLLVAAGVDTPEKLAAADPEALHARLVEVNTEAKLVRTVPATSRLAAWIEAAASPAESAAESAGS